MPACGCSGCSGRLAQLSSSSERSRPGSTTAPFGSEAITAAAAPWPARFRSIRRRSPDRGGGSRAAPPRPPSAGCGARPARPGHVGEIVRPVLGDDLEELDGQLPMGGEFLRHDSASRRDRPPRFRSRPSDWRDRRRDRRPVPAWTKAARRHEGSAMASSARGSLQASTSRIRASRRGSAPMAGSASAPRSHLPHRPRPRR